MSSSGGDDSPPQAVVQTEKIIRVGSRKSEVSLN